MSKCVIFSLQSSALILQIHYEIMFVVRVTKYTKTNSVLKYNDPSIIIS